MKTITIQEVPSPVSDWLQSMKISEEIAITDHDRIVEIVVRPVSEPAPLPPRLPDGRIDWSGSYAFRDRTGERMLTAEETQTILDESRGNW